MNISNVSLHKYALQTKFQLINKRVNDLTFAQRKKETGPFHEESRLQHD